MLELLLETAFRRDSRWVGRSGMGSAPRQEVPDEPMPKALGRYAVVDCIGQGGVGIVYRVEDKDLGRAIALKVLRSHFVKDQEHVARFGDEARLLGQLSHPGIVPVHETGVLPDGRPYFTMRLVEGQTLAALLRGRATLESDRALALRVLRQTCDALSYAHSLGITHGDVKPQNVMVGAFGEVQIMDFGFARSARAPASAPTAGFTRTTRAGTPAYMAPEQARAGNSEITPRTDVYGLGGILCEILTGEPPHTGDSRTGVIEQAARGDLGATRARLAACGADAALVAIALDCLASDPEARPRDARVVEERLTKYQDGVEERARAAEVSAAEARASLKQGRKAQRLAIALVSAIAFATVVVVLLLTKAQRQHDERRRTAAAAVEENLGEARRCITLAGERKSESESLLREALGACRRAESLARAEDGDAALLQSVLTLGAEIESYSARRARSRVLAVRLAELRHHVGDERSPGELERGYLSALADAGVASLQPPGPAAETLAALDLGSALIEALDDWAALRRRARLPTQDAWRETLALVNALDSDPWRAELRRAWSNDDTTRLEALSREPFDERQSTLSLSLLGRALTGAGRIQAALDFYRRACALHPHSASLCHEHAMLVRADGAMPDAALSARLLWMACASDPQDAHLLSDLAVALVSIGDATTAITIAEHATRVAPGDGRAWYVLGLGLRTTKGARKDVLAAFRRATELEFPSAALILADEYQIDGRIDAAIDLLAPLVAQAKDKPQRSTMAQAALALLYQNIGAVDQARALAEPFLTRPISNGRVAFGFAWIAMDTGRFALAGDVIANHLKTTDSRTGDALWRERLASLQRQARESADLANELVDSGDDRELPSKRNALRSWGLVARRMERPALAARAYRKLLQDPLVASDRLASDYIEGCLAVLEAAPETPGGALAARREALAYLGEIVTMLAEEPAASAPERTMLRNTLCILRLHPSLAWLRPTGSASRPDSVPAESAELWQRIDKLWREAIAD